jgi:hypothetical protein
VEQLFFWEDPPGKVHVVVVVVANHTLGDEGMITDTTPPLTPALTMMTTTTGKKDVPNETTVLLSNHPSHLGSVVTESTTIATLIPPASVSLQEPVLLSHDDDVERNHPWPNTYKRSIALLASPILPVQDAAMYTKVLDQVVVVVLLVLLPVGLNCAINLGCW